MIEDTRFAIYNNVNSRLIFMDRARLFGHVSSVDIPDFNPSDPHTYDVLEDGTIVLDYLINYISVTADNYQAVNKDLILIGNIASREPPVTTPGGGNYIVLADGTLLYDSQLYNRIAYSEPSTSNSLLKTIETSRNSNIIDIKNLPDPMSDIALLNNVPSAIDKQTKTGSSSIPSEMQYYSYSGTDIVAEIVVPGEGTMTLGELQTISYSTHRENTPVRTIGHVNPRGFVKGPRTIAGSLIFTNFNSYALYRVKRYMQVVSEHGVYPLADMLPPFDIVLTFLNEYGISSKMRILGISIIDEGGTMSIDDLVTESTMTYMARGIVPLTSTRTQV